MKDEPTQPTKPTLDETLERLRKAIRDFGADPRHKTPADGRQERPDEGRDQRPQ